MLREARAILIEEHARSAMRVIEAADFLTGGAAGFGRLIGAHGAVLDLVRLEAGEEYAGFRARLEARAEAEGARFVLIGGIDPGLDAEADLVPPDAPLAPDAVRLLDGPLHRAQRRALRLVLDNRRSILRAGRRLGKSTLCIALAADEALCGRFTAYVTPQFKLATPIFEALVVTLRPVLESKDKTQGVIRLSTGGVIDIWTIESGAVIARGRKYHRVIMDEVAHVTRLAKHAVDLVERAGADLARFQGRRGRREHALRHLARELVLSNRAQ